MLPGAIRPTPHKLPRMPLLPSPSAPLSQLILLRAVQRLDAISPLDDVQALRQAHAAERGPAARLLLRAQMLAKAQGLDRELVAWRGRLVWVALAAALGVGLLSYGLVKAVVGDDRQINAVAALLAVLGPHLLSLGLWLLLLCTGGTGAGLAGWGARLAAHWSGDKAGHSRLLLEAGFDVLARKPGLSAWAFGVLNHMIWSLALLLTLGGLVFAFSFLAYRLSWETTILDAGFFSGVARISGWLPAHLLGIAVPDASTTTTAGNDRVWALWLLGCTLVYGLGLRLLFLAFSVWRARRLLGRLSVDTQDPDLRQLIARFAALDASEVLDGERRPAPAVPRAGSFNARSTAAVIGYELPEGLPWPPAEVNAPLRVRTAGAADEKRTLLARLHEAAPQRLLLVCHGLSSPDRGTERFLREALQGAGQGALLAEGGAARWRAWAAEKGLPLDAVFDNPAEARQWLA